MNAAYPAFALRAEDVVGVYGGMLPRSPASSDASEVELEKKAQLVDHAREDGVDGLVTMVGVKWTAARAVAERAVGLAIRKLGRAAQEPRDARPRLPGSQFERHDAWLRRARAAKSPLLADASNEHLLRSFGTRIDVLLRLVGERAELAAPVQEGSPVIAAEVVNAVRHEMALHLDDVLLRRTQLAFARPLGDDAVERVARLMAAEAGWDAPRVDRELARGQAALARFRGR